MDREERDYTELNWDDVDFKSGNWAWSSGGGPLQNGEYAISFYPGDLKEIRYKMPKCINEMMALQEKFGADALRMAFNNLLGA